MSSPACADGYDTPAQQREDSTTFMVAKVVNPGPHWHRGLVLGPRAPRVRLGPGSVGLLGARAINQGLTVG